MSKTDMRPFVKIEPRENRRTNFHYGIRVKRKKVGDYYLCYMMGFDIAFACNTEEEMEPKSHAMIASFFEYYINNLSFKALIMELHDRGFKANQDAYTLHQLLKNKPTKAKFSSTNMNTPADFANAEELQSEFNREFAI